MIRRFLVNWNGIFQLDAGKSCGQIGNAQNVGMSWIFSQTNSVAVGRIVF